MAISQPCAVVGSLARRPSAASAEIVVASADVELGRLGAGRRGW